MTIARRAEREPLIDREAHAHVPMTAEQSAKLKSLAADAFEPEAFDPDLTKAEAARRIAALTAKLARQDGPPHTL